MQEDSKIVVGWEDYHWTMWDLLGRVECVIEENKDRPEVLLVLIDFLASLEWNLTANRQFEGVAKENFFVKNLAVITKGKEYVKESFENFIEMSHKLAEYSK